MTTSNSGAQRSSPLSQLANQSGQTPPAQQPSGTTDEQSTSGVGAALDQAKDMAGGLVTQAKEQASPQIDSQKERAAGSLNDAAHALRETSQHLREQGGGTVAQYADQAAGQVERFANYLRTQDVSDMVNQVESFARRQPAVFVGGSFALGMLAARFLKSSGRRETNDAQQGASSPRQTPAGWHTPATTPASSHPYRSPAFPAAQQHGGPRDTSGGASSQGSDRAATGSIGSSPAESNGATAMREQR